MDATEMFEGQRERLRAVAYRMLGSLTEADDAVQETWLRLARTDVGEIDNPPAWLTTVVARISMNMLRSRSTRREETLDVALPAADEDPEHEAVLADSVGLALLVVLDTLPPAERLAFVLHDMFAVPFDEIAPLLERSPAATRQLASRARRRVRGGEAAPDVARQRKVVEAFLEASRGGDFEALVSLLDPEIVLRADAAAGPTPFPVVLRGVRNVTKGALLASERIQVSEPAIVNGTVGLVMAPGGHLRLALAFTYRDDRITEIDVIADPARLPLLDLAVLGGDD